MQKLVKESEYFIAWLLFWLASTVGIILVSTAVGFTLSAIGAGPYEITLVCGVAGFLVSIPLSYIMFRVFVAKMIVRKVQQRTSTTSVTSPNQNLTD